MSHVVKLDLQMKNLNGLKKAVEKLGLKFQENVKTFRYHVSSTSSCDHAIEVPNSRYGIGVSKSGNNYEIKWDPYHSEIVTALGGRLGEGLKKEYAVAVAIQEAEAEGMYVTRYDNADGSVRLEAEVN